MRLCKFGALLSATIIAALVPAVETNAQSWPDRPVKVIVPYAAGGATDAIARPWSEELSKAFGQQFVIENRGGAAGMIGMEALVKSPPDGYSYILTPNAPLSVVPSLRKTAYDPLKDVTPVGRAGDVLTGFVIHPSLGIKTMQQLVEHAKKNPGKIVFGSSGTGAANHLRIEALKYRAGIDILHIPYRGGADSLNDLLPGTIHMMNEPITLPHVKAGKLILLAINGSRRNPDFPDVPTLTEAGIKDADVPIWFSIWAPAGTPKAIIDKMNAKMIELAKDEEFKKKLWAVNAIPPLQTPEQMTQALKDDIAANAVFIKAANVKIE